MPVRPDGIESTTRNPCSRYTTLGTDAWYARDVHSRPSQAESMYKPVYRGNCKPRWLKCNGTQGNAFPPPSIYGSKRFPTTDCYNAWKMVHDHGQRTQTLDVPFPPSQYCTSATGKTQKFSILHDNAEYSILCSPVELRSRSPVVKVLTVSVNFF